MADEEKPGIIYLGTAAELGWDAETGGEEPTNWERADRAATALQVYHDATQGCDPFMGESYGDEGGDVMAEAFADLLTDLMHLANRCDLDFEQLVSSAEVNYTAEHDEEEEADED